MRTSHIIAIALVGAFSLFLQKPLRAQGFYKGEAEELPKAARETGLPYVVELNATWCGYCKLFERQTLKNEEVIEYIEGNYYMATMDGEKGYGLKLNDEYNVRAFPTLLFFGPDGKLLKKMTGFQDSDYFLFNLKKYYGKFEKKYGKE